MVEYENNATIQAINFSVDLLQSLLWQYQNAPNLQSLVNQKNTWYGENETDFWNDWYADVFNLATANDFGLVIWSIILDQPIYINNGPAPADKPTFGFGSYYVNFTRGNFSSTTGNTYQFPTEIARIILQLRYFQLVSSGTIPETNRMLAYVFSGYGPAWLEDGLNMTQKYVFNFPVSSDLLLALNSFDLLPRPAGVKSEIYQGTVLYFGFGPYHANFTRGNFGEF